MGSSNQQDNLTAAYIDQVAVIRVEGRGSFKISPTLKQFIHQVIRSKSATQILIDMSACCGMDSTFMGVLAGLSYHVKKHDGFTLKLINLSEKNQKLLITLGVDRVVSYTPSSTPEEAQLLTQPAHATSLNPTQATDRLEAAKTTLEAHKTLVDIHPDNYAKFKSVLELLKKDVRTLDPQ